MSYKNIKETDRLPSEKICRDLLKKLPKETLNELRAINKQILHIKSKAEDVIEVCINFDDTVITILGNQKNCSIGYNPRYHDRLSSKEKTGAIAGTDEVLDITLETGHHHSNYNFLEFFQNCVNQLPEKYILKRVRLDRGFFDDKNLTYFQEEGYEYIVKCKMYSSIKKIIQFINENSKYYKWEYISSKFAVNEITLLLPSWEKARRFIIVRKTLEPKIYGQLNFKINLQNSYLFSTQVPLLIIKYEKKP